MGGKVADRLNDIIGANQALGDELERVSRVVGKEGKLSQRVSFKGTDQVWGRCIESVNSLIEDLVRPSNEMQRVIGAVADGDLSKKVSADVQGEMLELKNTINGMVDQLNGFISEVTRVAREVGTEGKLGQAAAVTIEVAGVWKELTDNVNLMAGNLTGQVRDIAEVTTAVANGDLSKKITADVRGEFLELKNTVNAMVDQLNRFAGEVTRVAREVGVEGKLGGQAQSQEVAGVWKDLTDDVNQLAANLTNQVRAIAEVATAVTEGDLTRQVSVEASGEVAVLKDLLNEMIRNLRETMRQNTEQDWLKTNLERFTRMLQGQRDLATVSTMILSELTPLVSAQHGVFYALTEAGDGGEPMLEFQAGYGYKERKHLSNSFRLGEGLVGQCALEKERILLTDVPGDYIQISSGLGESPPLNIIVLPILFEGSVRAVIELASFSAFSQSHQSLLDQLTESIGLVLNTVAATSVTDELLEQSLSQAQGAAVAPGAAAPVQRGARRAGEAPGRQEQRGRGQVPGGRGGEALRRGEGARAVGLLALQVGVHRQHVPRAAHAAQQPAGAGRAARGQPRRQPHRPPGASTPTSSARRASTCSSCSTTSSTWPRSSPTRSSSRRARSRSPTCSTAWRRRSARSPRTRASRSRPSSTTGCRRRSRRIPTGCGRCSRTCSPTRSSSPSTARSCCASRRRRTPGSRSASATRGSASSRSYTR